LNFDHIKWLIILNSDYFKRHSLNEDFFRSRERKLRQRAEVLQTERTTKRRPSLPAPGSSRNYPSSQRGVTRKEEKAAKGKIQTKLIFGHNFLLFAVVELVAAFVPISVPL
jgi:hypothetical protein